MKTNIIPKILIFLLTIVSEILFYVYLDCFRKYFNSDEINVLIILLLMLPIAMLNVLITAIRFKKVFFIIIFYFIELVMVSQFYSLLNSALVISSGTLTILLIALITAYMFYMRTRSGNQVEGVNSHFFIGNALSIALLIFLGMVIKSPKFCSFSLFCIVLPFLEELFLRQFIYSRIIEIEKKRSIFIWFVFVSILFSLSHTNRPAFNDEVRQKPLQVF